MECLACISVSVFDSLARVRRLVREYLPAVGLRDDRQPTSEDYVSMEAEIEGQMVLLQQYVDQLNSQRALCRARARADGVSRARKLALYAQCKRLEALQEQTSRQFSVLEDSRLTLQSNAMSVGLVTALRGVSRACRGHVRTAEAERLVESLENCVSEINESVQVAREIHETIATAAIGGAGVDADVDDADLARFLDEDSDQYVTEMRAKPSDVRVRPASLVAVARSDAVDDEPVAILARV